MTLNPSERISRYFDELLTAEEHQEFQDWLRASPDHRREFARQALLHDRLRNEHLAIAVTPLSLASGPSSPRLERRSPSPTFAFAGGLVAATAILAVIWLGASRSPVSAATELQRIISAQEHAFDRTYEIAVEEVAGPRRRSHPRTKDDRPPKAPMDGAVLHVRRGGQFVLVRPLPNGQQFITGSNGKTSWAVRPDSPVRVSRDLTRFNRDLPGHEQQLPLIEVERGLEQLEAAYDVQLLPIESSEDAAADSAPTRLLVAVKKRGYRGPQRAEITYEVVSGRIRQLRFVEMPYGPELLTLRLTLAEERPFAPDFFDHTTHHAPNRTIEEE